MSSCQPTSSVKALKEEQLKQWPKLIFSAIGLLVEEALLLLDTPALRSQYQMYTILLPLLSFYPSSL